MLQRIEPRGWAGRVAVGLLLLSILDLNANRYFSAYAWGLPYHNTPFGRLIAEDMRMHPVGTPLYVIGCCWADWKEPEAESITFAFKHMPPIHFETDVAAVCASWDHQTDAYVYLDPNDEAASAALSACAPAGVAEKTFSNYGDPIYLRYHLVAAP